MPLIPIIRPKLPSAERLMPYLQSIDRSRFYSNYGPLALSLEDRLAAHYGLAQSTVGTVANATVGLAIALSIQHPPRGTLCVMPAWTFVASAHAAVMAGLIPYFVDVDSATWALDARTISDEIARAPGQVGAVMPVVPFGSPIDLEAWDAFRSRTGLAVVIDAAAAFDSLVPQEVPAVVSLHATKVLSAGEGGFIISTDPSIQRDVRMRANFGFAGSRQAQAVAFNAKLSEYHAAGCHAGLDEWVQTRTEWQTAARTYRQAISSSNQVRLQQGFGENWISSSCVLSFGSQVADRIERMLAEQNIETRRWWGQGAHNHPATISFPHTTLSITEMLSRSTLAVPFYRDVEPRAINRITELVMAGTDAAQEGCGRVDD